MKTVKNGRSCRNIHVRSEYQLRSLKPETGAVRVVYSTASPLIPYLDSVNISTNSLYASRST